MAFTDFKNGLSNADDYLSATNSISAELTGSVADIGNLVISAEFDFNLKEIICSLLAGRGLKLPNIQICISLNLKALLGDLFGQIQDKLYQALAKLDAAMDKFMDHLKLDQVLGRINGVLAEITSIANMINFCSAPIDPIQIPNVLENAMDSFLGAGKGIVDKIGTIIPDEIGGCLINGVSSFNGGILGKLNDVYDDLVGGVLTDAFIDSIVADIDSVSDQITDLIDRERNVATNYEQGGSELAEDPRETNTGMGTLYNATDEGITGATRNASMLQSVYQPLSSYQVVDSNGVVYNNIFETFCDPDLLSVLRRAIDPTPEISEQIPVLNYCGEVIGYTKSVLQVDPIVSTGLVPGTIDQPGFNAGGLPTNPITAAQSQTVAAAAVTNITNTTVNNVNGTSTVFADDQAEMFALDVDIGQMVFLTDTRITYVNNGSETGTIADWEIVGSGPAAGTVAGTTNTTDATQTEVFFDGGRKTPAAGTLWFVTLTAVANRSDQSDATAMKIEGLIDNNSGTVTVVGGSGNHTSFNSTPATSNYELSIDIASNQLRVQVQGDAGHTVSWTVRLDFIEA